MINVLEWLESQVGERPGKTAVADVNSRMTFSEMQAQARSVASFAIESGVEPCSAVALLAGKRIETIAGMFGAVYARCFYWVLDDRQPAARIQAIFEKLQPQLILADDEHYDQAVELFGTTGARVARLDEALRSPVDADALASRREQALDIDPVYVNFTSGSTGMPKGVIVSHRSVIDFIGQFVNVFGIGADDQLANQAPLDYDGSVKDVYSGLASGATVHLVPREYFSIPTKLMDFLADRQITTCTWAVSAMCFVSTMGGFDYRVPTTVRRVIFTGEIMPVKHLNIWRKHLPDALYANVYGPTEVTCNCTYHILDREYERGDSIPIGRPFPNEKVFLLDEGGALVDRPGEHGEIYVGGSTLALGYCNDPERTAAAFVQNPLNATYRETVYRTGDLAYYDDEMRLVFVGRKDHQVKHMGQRIELGEIETVAQGIDGVERACCVYNERKKRILLYYSGPCEKDSLVAWLQDQLPSYMVPNKTKQLEQMPLMHNGKIDRSKLAELAR